MLAAAITRDVLLAIIDMVFTLLLYHTTHFYTIISIWANSSPRCREAIARKKVSKGLSPLAGVWGQRPRGAVSAICLTLGMVGIIHFKVR